VNSTVVSASYPSLRHRVIVNPGRASGIGETLVEAFAVQNAQIVFLELRDTMVYQRNTVPSQGSQEFSEISCLAALLYKGPGKDACNAIDSYTKEKHP
jgi:hypothetical protein